MAEIVDVELRVDPDLALSLPSMLRTAVRAERDRHEAQVNVTIGSAAPSSSKPCTNISDRA
jgi:hypothetical protein